MNIAELFVRLRADNSDLDRKLAASERQLLRLHGSTTKLESGFRSTQLQTGRLGNQFASLAGQIAGVHPIVGNLAQVMGNFAIGGAVTLGVLGGLALIALAYDKLTSSARNARKETDAFIKSLVDEAKAAFNASYAGRQLAIDRAYLELEAAKKAFPVGMRSVLGSVLTGRPMIADADAAAAVKRLADATTSFDVATKRAAKTWEELNPPVGRIKDRVVALKKVVDETVFSWREMLEAVYAIDNTMEKLTLRAAQAILGGAPNLDPNHVQGALRDFGTTISGVDTDIGLTKEQIKTRDALVGTLDKNTNVMRDAIWGAASQSAHMIVGALNIGGGGRGSQLGGALGGTAGFAAGFIFGGGPVGGAIGSTIGNILGSAIGGLFDSNTRAVNANTLATQANTMALLLNPPSGYKVAGSRYDATDIKELGREVMRHATRGGAPPLMAGR